MAGERIQQVLFQRNKRVVDPPTGKAELVTLSLQEFEAQYHFEPDGVNLYYGVNAGQVEAFGKEKRALRAKHRQQIENLRQSLLSSAKPVKTLNVCLEPSEPVDPYEFLERQVPLLQALAAELGASQRDLPAGKKLAIALRHASEMNDANVPPDNSQPWGRRPGVVDDEPQQEAYKRTFRQVRDLFREPAPDVLFTFSPLLHRGITGDKYEVLPKYWPGDGYVDGISCTWYARYQDEGDSTAVEEAVDVMRQYVQHRIGRGLPFGIDELGGVLGAGTKEPNPARQNDRVLQEMLTALTLPPLQDLTFRYVTFFLDGDWGADATLSFLRPPA